MLNGPLLVIQLMLAYLCACFHLAAFGKMSHTSFFFYVLMLILIMGILVYYLETTKSLLPFLRGYCTYVAFLSRGLRVVQKVLLEIKVVDLTASLLLLHYHWIGIWKLMWRCMLAVHMWCLNNFIPGLAGKRPRESRKQTAKQSQVRDYQLASFDCCLWSSLNKCTRTIWNS